MFLGTPERRIYASIKLSSSRLSVKVVVHEARRKAKEKEGWILDWKVARAGTAGRLLNILEILTESPKSLVEKIYAGPGLVHSLDPPTQFAFHSTLTERRFYGPLQGQEPYEHQESFPLRKAAQHLGALSILCSLGTKVIMNSLSVQGY